MCHGGCQASNGPFCAGFGTLLLGICCWPQLGRTWYSSYHLCHLLWELCIQQAFLQLPLEQSYDGLGRDHQGVWDMSLGADALSSFSWRYEFQLQYHHRVRLGWMCTWVQRKGESLQSQILPQSLHSGTTDECLCSQPWLFIRSCHFFTWDHLAKVFCQ